jgi:hypothetical protein
VSEGGGGVIEGGGGVIEGGGGVIEGGGGVTDGGGGVIDGGGEGGAGGWGGPPTEGPPGDGGFTGGDGGNPGDGGPPGGVVVPPVASSWKAPRTWGVEPAPTMANELSVRGWLIATSFRPVRGYWRCLAMACPPTVGLRVGRPALARPRRWL